MTEATTIFNSAIPVLPVLDIDAAVAFYTSVLGFTSGYIDAGSYAVLMRDAIELHVWHTDEQILPDNSSCRFNVSNVEALYSLCQEYKVVHPNGHLIVQPWGLKEFSIVDPFGNLIRFAEQIA